MGLDFLRRTAKSSTKAWDRGKTGLSVPTLFSQQPECHTRTVLADVDDRAHVSAGDTVTLHLQGADMLVVHENTPIGKVGNPPPDLVNAMRSAGGCALAEFRQINSLSGTADVEIR